MYIAITFLIALLALLLVFWGGRILLSGKWILGFIRGTLGLLFLATALLIVLVAADVYSYRNLAEEHSVGTVSFRKTGEQRYEVTFSDADGLAQRFELHGDQWQLDARMLKWKGVLARWGIQPAYRLDRLSGRYLTLQDERIKERSVHQLDSSAFGIDIWQSLRGIDKKLSFVDAVYGTATFLPMEDGAVYDVRITHNGLLARPLNQQATSAVEEWQ
ncbi:cation/multidrug efflux pump [Microbulbifer thermotolerans]|uniref:Cation/multidrug efflux pump n=1 Tax=Microbulbifer thermotolerans TaxID=252514 RepID=A0A143HLY2_MICTH|nr:cation/multidrug efflux pump [Microbulbifer thermotolerans]AMX02724.1 cation/multidrug efflux pump [Microbulbifer thermotolerans]MCX2779577.1 cation/multidrug efflux pump [Microbulbifer thermotolerans]MCX2794555.1 cation/multidrug efflux pump [Microbulbifer thermotolerans]MCX2801382.1 cation/multidrug efflux pump [Microbulbifer thermotolerans]MCX2804992.1 cation/multidrug efflux pump [Microbulbifer thermotolerans]